MKNVFTVTWRCFDCSFKTRDKEKARQHVYFTDHVLDIGFHS